MGTPAIISNIPGPIDAVLENETALLIPPRSADELLSAMEKMTDDDLRARLSRGAVRFISESFEEGRLLDFILQRKLELLKQTNE